MLQRSAFLILGSALAAFASASPYSYITWDTSTITATTAHGTIPSSVGPIGVDLQGNFTLIYTNYPSWTPTTTYCDGVIVDNAPNTPMMVRADVAGSYSLTFSQPVSNLAFSLWSVGQGRVPITYDFDQNPTFISGGPGAEYGGQAITVNGTKVTGEEGNGTVLFKGPMTTLNWDIVGDESFHGWTIGLQHVQTVPEPASMAALGVGALAVLRRRKRR